MLRKIQGASDKTNSIESVKWYTIPTTTEMPADDVTFNTIGFTGTMTANSTFTLYRDNEGTGAKSYNVYCKNLSGNYTLTLTTGVSSATNFMIKGGSNIVARILVDENGNIVSQSMTATNTIESGNNQPATSSGVDTAIQSLIDVASSLPTDAVLHYSFDEIPDLPNGTAVYKKDYDWISDDNWYNDSHNTTFSASNGIAKWTSTNTSTVQLAKSIDSISGKIFIVKFRCSKTNVTCRAVGVYSHTFPTITQMVYTGGWAVLTGIIPSSYNSRLILQFYLNESENSVEISQIYIGDGSYSTPIIDNANGQNKATNNGGIAVQGVSGKGIYFLNGKYAKINDNFLFAPNFSISLWIKPDNNTNGLQGIILRNGQLLLRNGDTSENFLMFILTGANGTLLNKLNIGNLLPPNVWTNLVIVRNATTFLVYTNGVETYRTTLADSTISSAVDNFLISQNNLTRPQAIDDLLIFDRALSEIEVQALYQNKANTPKYYDINNYNLKQIKDITAQSTDFADFQSRMAGLATRSLQLIEPTEDER
jgi:hypothetical protein